MRKLLITVLMTVATAAMAEGYAYLTIDGSDGSRSYEVGSIVKITFSSTDMVLWKSETEQIATLPLSSLSKMQFTTGAAGIATIETGSRMQMHDGQLTVQARAGSRITIYNIKGVAVRAVTASAGETTINMGGLAKGVYIVKVNDEEARKLINQ